ncbi:hypothetical protein [Nocardia sp. NPDC051832]|uniref:hypothetical protein n=1 Tax=Nocardia sp. NPDC051832 TaxID=3155673 RepID=UPI003414657E
MKFGKWMVTALLAIAATSITAGATNAKPVDSDPVLINGTDHGVNYATSLSADGTGIYTKLTSGKFELTPEATAVTVTAPDGTLVAQFPMAFQIADHQINLIPEITADGSALTLRSPARSVADPVAFNTAFRDITVPQAQEYPRAKEIGMLGALAGGAIGAAIGAAIFGAIGTMYFVVGAIPGALIGGILGAAMGGILGFIIL